LDITPASVLAMWAAGLAAAAAAVAWRRTVGTGFVWLSGGVILLLGIPAALAGGGPWAWVGVGIVVPGTAAAGRTAAGALLTAGGVGFLVAAVPDGGVAASITGAVFLGGITVEMMLGHWFLVDPTLPRRPLQGLALAAGVGVIADSTVLAASGVVPWEEGDLAVGVGYLVLAGMTLILVAAVWASLRESGYPAVMAATGLSYLAVLTAVGAAVIGRLLTSGSVLG
jgi:hypothetical protein